MHEASLVQGLLRTIDGSIADYNAANPLKKVTGISEIKCSAGLLACFEPQALQACFEIFAEGTPAEKAELIIDTSPLECTCGDCGHKFSLLRREFVCPFCASENINFKGGNGLVLQAVKVECEGDND